jgi:hypothetical protein
LDVPTAISLAAHLSKQPRKSVIDTRKPNLLFRLLDRGDSIGCAALTIQFRTPSVNEPLPSGVRRRDAMGSPLSPI